MPDIQPRTVTSHLYMYVGVLHCIRNTAIVLQEYLDAFLSTLKLGIVNRRGGEGLAGQTRTGSYVHCTNLLIREF